MRAIPWLLLAAVVGIGSLSEARSVDPGTPPAAATPPPAIYVRQIADRKTFDTYSKVVGADRFTKFIIDLKTKNIFFIDVGLFPLHADFVLGVLLKQKWTAANIRAYNKNYDRDKPQFIFGYITEHLQIGKFTFSFWEGDKISAEQIAFVRNKLNETFFQRDLPFRPDSPAQEATAQAVTKLGVRVLTNTAIYKSAPYQALHEGEAIGMLRVVPVGTPYESLTFNRGDIVILQEAYPDISPVAGIVLTRPATPLAHVNLRARAWDIPNASIRDASAKFLALDGKQVYYRVGSRDFELREATADEAANAERARSKVARIEVPAARLADPRMPMLTTLQANDANRVGAKAANLGSIASAELDEVHVPRGFAVPFFYYAHHMRRHGLDDDVAEVLGDPRWNDTQWRRAALRSLREKIQSAPIDEDVLDAVYKRVRLKLDGRGVFVRSSTNAEDLPGFNGAGLYETVPNVRGKAALGNAIKTVWSSLWNFRAVEERSLFGIDHRRVYVAVLIQEAVSATAAGVLITTNLYDARETDTFTINAKWGLGIRVVEGTRVPEQILYDTANHGTRIISRADDPVMLVFDESGGIREVANDNAEVILTEERARRLAETVIRFRSIFSAAAPLDVEWLFEGEKVWIVQSRPYVGG